MQASEGGGDVHQTLSQEIVRFDYEAPYFERTVMVPDDLLDEDTPPGDLKFVYTDEVILMWHPRGLEQCGSHWIDLTGLDYGETTGHAIAPEDFLVVKPLDVLDWAIDDPVHVETTELGSTYHVTVPSDVGISLSEELLNDPETLDILAETEVVAEVLLPRDGGSMKVSIDFSDAYHAIDTDRRLRPGAGFRTTWTITPDIPPFDTTLPDDIAEGDCMDPGTAT